MSLAEAFLAGFALFAGGWLSGWSVGWVRRITSAS